MRNKIILTANVVNLLETIDALQHRGTGEEGMGVVFGQPGEGKTTTLGYALNRDGGIFLRARSTWTVTSMLRALMRELNQEPHRHRDPMIDVAVEQLLGTLRPIFIDEADYLLKQPDMLDAIRDIYDLLRRAKFPKESMSLRAQRSNLLRPSSHAQEDCRAPYGRSQ